ncbi:unnamed protein product [Darwinula stevensoni]|uniref:Uncharacterized protein n=1 Tax=Darwinula stevensoni TaxID=69355 RepID=A0A7R9A6Y0_9CRUS|nr:unnamed protein product [Darwinula stevensoni]CAG0889327.1 unnamed protein product [Darwinula stevensoni]
MRVKVLETQLAKEKARCKEFEELLKLQLSMHDEQEGKKSKIELELKETKAQVNRLEELLADERATRKELEERLKSELSIREELEQKKSMIELELQKIKPQDEGMKD